MQSISKYVFKCLREKIIFTLPTIVLIFFFTFSIFIHLFCYCVGHIWLKFFIFAFGKQRIEIKKYIQNIFGFFLQQNDTFFSFNIYRKSEEITSQKILIWILSQISRWKTSALCNIYITYLCTYQHCITTLYLS